MLAVVIADRMMWFQYVADAGIAPEQVEAASIRTSLRRMSRAAIVVLDKENSRGAVVFPEEEKEGSAVETAVSAQTSDDGTDDAVGSENSKGSSLLNTLISMSNLFMVIVVGGGYPVAILPYYRAESTTE